MWFLKLFLSCAILKLSLGDEDVLLDIPQGTLKGLKTTTAYHGMPMYSFKGIPYANPNTGPNKFRSPELADGWTGVRDATKHGDTCVFFCMMRQGVFGDEDCLFINVYTPDLNTDAKRSVMVFIHPGGYNSGSGDDDLFGADYLLERDVIVVTMNYRVGAVGFLNTGDANAPGNAGLKDQVMALIWIQENILYFGGCRNKVTIFGQSSGSASVQYHMISPMSQGLFSRAIMQSGTFAATWSISYTPRESAMLLGEQLGIKASSTDDLVQQLSQVSAKDLVIATSEIDKTLNFMNGGMHLFNPSVEADFGQEVFLPDNPWELIKSGQIADVPLMVGITSDESGLFVPAVSPMIPNIQDHMDVFIPLDLNATDPAQRKMIADKLNEFYFHGEPIKLDPPTEFTDLLSDVFFNYGTVLTTTIMNSRMNSPVYQYLFNFCKPFGFMKTLMKIEDEGVMHGDDLSYIFYSNFYKMLPAPGSMEEQKTNEMVEMWTNFAKEGDPSVTMDVAKVKWEPMGTDKNYLDIGNDLTMKQSIFKERIEFWADLYKNILDDYTKLF